MNIIIGGSGFVGSNLISILDKKKTINMDKKESPFYSKITTYCNICNKETLIFPPDTKSIVLLAAEHRDDVFPKSLYYDVNVQGTKNVLEAMDKVGVKNIIFTSSVAIYGLNKQNPTESHVHDPFNHYGKSKWQAEKIIKEWYENDSDGKSVTILRPTVIFGERNRGNVYNLLKQISSGKFMIIGKGDNKKSMAYVGNIVAFIINRLDALQKGYHVFNYVDKPDYSMTELASVVGVKMKVSLPKQKIPYWLGMIVGYGFDLLSFLSRKKIAISSVRIKKFCATTQFDSQKAHNVFKAPYSLEQGLEKTLENEFICRKEDDTLFYTE